MIRDNTSESGAILGRGLSRAGPDVRTARHHRVSIRVYEMTPVEIAVFRRDTLGVSQKLFADMLNVSIQTVHAWEQGRRKPSGSALRLLCLAQREPEKLKAAIKDVASD